MRLWPFPSLMFVGVVFVVNMQVFVVTGFMGVRYDERISGGPQDER